MRTSKTLLQNSQSKLVSLQLPPAHPKQIELINAFDARRLPNDQIIYDDELIAKVEAKTGQPLPLAYKDLRFVVGACGTKFGKTYGCSIKIVKEAWRNWDWVLDQPLDHPGLYWWVAPTGKQARNAFNLIQRLLPKGLYQEYRSKDDLKLVLKNPDGSEHSTIEFKSAENYDGLRGFEVSFFIFDEAARGVNYEAFVSVNTTITKTLGKGIYISTPNGRNWFYDIYRRGEKSKLMPGEVDDWAEFLSIRMPTWTNPHVTERAILDLRKGLPKEVFEQEVAAKFMDNAAGVFNNIDSCIKGLVNGSGAPIWETPKPGRRYVAGVDLARKRDYTVIVVFDTVTKHLAYFKRMTIVDWGTQKKFIAEIAKHYNNALVCMDATGLGDVIHSDLHAAGVNTEPYVLSNKSKQPLIQKLQVALEFQKLTFPQIDVMIKELRDYEYEISPNGTITYSAPAGFHDDTVIALALANWVLDAAPFKYKFKSVAGV